MSSAPFRTTTFSAVFSNTHADTHVRTCPLREDTILLTLPDTSVPTRQRYFHPIAERDPKQASSLHGIVRCNDYQTVEAIRSRARDQYNVVVQLLLGGFERDTRLTCTYTIHIVLDLSAYVMRGSRIPSMAW